MGAEKALEFSAGYVVEQSLSVDNLLVFLVLFEYFKVPPGPMQDKALAYGLYGAVVCRAVFVGLGAVALAEFRGVLLVFAGILLATSAKILLGGEEDEDDDPSKMRLYDGSTRSRWCRRRTRSMRGPVSIFYLDSQGIRRATPLSGGRVPGTVRRLPSTAAGGLWGLGRPARPHADMFAILGLRAWYGVLARAAQELEYSDCCGCGPGLRGLSSAATSALRSMRCWPSSSSARASASVMPPAVAILGSWLRCAWRKPPPRLRRRCCAQSSPPGVPPSIAASELASHARSQRLPWRRTKSSPRDGGCRNPPGLHPLCSHLREQKDLPHRRHGPISSPSSTTGAPHSWQAPLVRGASDAGTLFRAARVAGLPRSGLPWMPRRLIIFKIARASSRLARFGSSESSDSASL